MIIYVYCIGTNLVYLPHAIHLVRRSTRTGLVLRTKNQESSELLGGILVLRHGTKN